MVSQDPASIFEEVMPIICRRWPDGLQEWMDEETGFLHSENDQPSKIYGNGDKVWHKMGKIHRETGPALEYATINIDFNGYYIDGYPVAINKMKDNYPALYADYVIRKIMSE